MSNLEVPICAVTGTSEEEFTDADDHFGEAVNVIVNGKSETTNDWLGDGDDRTLTIDTTVDSSGGEDDEGSEDHDDPASADGNTPASSEDDTYDSNAGGSTVSKSHELWTLADGKWTLNAFSGSRTDTGHSQSASTSQSTQAAGTAQTHGETEGESLSQNYVRTISVTGSATQTLTTSDESGSFSFDASEGETGQGAPADATDAVSGSVIFSLVRGIITHGENTRLSSAVLDVSGTFSDDDTGTGGFHIHVVGSPRGFTTTIDTTDTNLFADLNVTVGTEDDWLQGFLVSLLDAIKSRGLGDTTETTTAGTHAENSVNFIMGPTIDGSNTTLVQARDGQTRTMILGQGGRVQLDRTVDDATGAVVESHSATFDDMGHKLTQTDGDSTIAWTYDEAGHKTSETVAFGTAQAATTLFVWQGNNLVSVTDPEGNTTTFGYDSQGRVISITDALGHTLTKTYDAQGHVASITNRNGLRREFRYDAQGREIGETWYAADGLTVTDHVSYTYDADGRVASAGNDAGTYSYSYNTQGQIAQVAGPFGLTLTFSYDSDGNRIGVQDSLGGSTTSSYDDASRVIGRFFSQSGQSVLGITQSFDADGRLTAQTRTNSAGASVVATTFGYDLAGNLTGLLHARANGSEIADYGFSFGYWFDDSVGMHQVWHRWYDPTTGRWMAKDPMGFDAGDANLYRYASNNVTNAVDPTGLEETTPENDNDRNNRRRLVEDLRSRINAMRERRRRDTISRFFGYDPYGPATKEEQELWKNLGQASDTVKYRVDDHGNIVPRKPSTGKPVPYGDNPVPADVFRAQFEEKLKKLQGETAGYALGIVEGFIAGATDTAKTAVIGTKLGFEFLSWLTTGKMDKEFVKEHLGPLADALDALGDELRDQGHLMVQALATGDTSKLKGRLGEIAQTTLDIAKSMGESMGNSVVNMSARDKGKLVGQLLWIALETWATAGATEAGKAALEAGKAGAAALKLKIVERFAKLRGIAKAEDVAQTLRQVAKGATGAEAKALSSVAEAVEKKGGKVDWKWLDEQLRVITNKSCFAAGTPLLTPTGAKAIEDFKVGDAILSRDENDALAPVEVRLVEDVFVRTSPILRLVVRGREILTTVEHPFWVHGKGWTPAGSLQVGDLLPSHDEQLSRVEAIEDTGTVSTVYNLQVGEYHTYFVGSHEWGFTVWAHNSHDCFEAFFDAATNKWRVRNARTKEVHPTLDLDGKAGKVEYQGPLAQDRAERAAEHLTDQARIRALPDEPLPQATRPVRKEPKKLAENLDRKVGPRPQPTPSHPANYEAAHLVPVSPQLNRSPQVKQAVKDAKAALDAAGIDLNDARNGFWTNHSTQLGTSTDKYFLELGRVMNEAKGRGGNSVQQALEDLLQRVKAGEFVK